MSIEHEERPNERRFLLIGVAVAVVLVVSVAVVAVLLIRDGDGGSGGERAPELATFEELLALARTAGGPVFWVGPRPGRRYEVSQTADGRFYIRYLPRDVEAGDPRASFLTVGTYPVENAVADVRRRQQEQGAVSRELRGGTLAVYNQSTPRNVFVAFPGSNRLVEVYDPSPATARQLAYSGAVRPVALEEGLTPEERGDPVAATRAKLEQVAADVPHPVYWLGPRRGFTYELTRLRNGEIYIRYLPEGVPVGHFRPRYDIVGTYPAPNAFDEIEENALDPDAVAFDLPRGGRAYYERTAPTNVHFAFPGDAVRVEVFHPRAGRAERLVRSGRVVPIR